RGGFRYGNTELADAIIKDGLWCAFDACLMGLSTERYAAGGISRDEQDTVALQSHARAAAAIAAGRLADEIVPVPVPQRKGDPIMVSVDEGVRATTTMQSLGALRPAFDTNGTITAGNASQISDGGSAVVVMSRQVVEQRGVAGSVGVERFQDLQVPQRDGIEDQVVGHFVEPEPGQMGDIPTEMGAQVVQDRSGGTDGGRPVAQSEAVQRGHLEVFAQGEHGRLRQEDPVVMW
ncbi:MAG: hypothetical protein EBU81_11215, partial [Proteobacteria bacterium]|nr:hypothetical protein [Pseudomonadota bacterium]